MTIVFKRTLKLFLLFAFIIGFAQKTPVLITGKIVEEKTLEPIPFGTIAVYDKVSNKVINGTTSDENGNFSVKVNRQNFYITISFMGFETKKITEFQTKNNQVRLATIQLKQDSQVLDDVVVTGEVSKTVFKPSLKP